MQDQCSSQTNEIGVSPSFNCYSTDNPSSIAAAKVSREVNEQTANDQFHQFNEIDEQHEEDDENDDFEFSLQFSGDQFSTQDLAFQNRILLPIFNTDLVTQDDVLALDKSAIIPLQNLLPTEDNESLFESSSEPSEFEQEDDDAAGTGTFCVTWRKAEVRSTNPALIKKSRSTGSENESGSRRWKIKDIIRRSNSLGKESVYFLCPKRVEASCKKGLVGSVEAPKVVGKVQKTMKSSPSVHELFYVQKRAELKGGKVKSYLPYRQDILGFKVHINGDANKKLPF